jgi:DNA-binding transcriptional MerR regulator
VDDFTTKWVSTSDVMSMLRVSRRTIDNYIKAGKFTPTPIGKRNYFTITQVKGLMYTPPIPETRSLYDQVQIMMQRLAQIEEAGEDW